MKAVVSTALLGFGIVRGLDVSSRQLRQEVDGECENIVCRNGDKNFCNSNVDFHNEDIYDCCNDDYCEVCHPNGCDQCCDGTLKGDYQTPCKPCCEYDEYATRCTDFVGSQACKPGCKLEYVPISQTIFASYPTDVKRMQKCVCQDVLPNVPPPPPPQPRPSLPPPEVLPYEPPPVVRPPPRSPSPSPRPPPRSPSPSPRPPPRSPSPSPRPPPRSPSPSPRPPPRSPSPSPRPPPPPPSGSNVLPFEPPPQRDCGNGGCVKEDTNFCKPGYKFLRPATTYDCCKDAYCRVCHPNGCDECCPGSFKADYSSPCMPYCEYDVNAMRCTDFVGTQQCKAGYKIVDVLAQTTCFKGYVAGNKKMQRCAKM